MQVEKQKKINLTTKIVSQMGFNNTLDPEEEINSEMKGLSVENIYTKH